MRSGETGEHSVLETYNVTMGCHIVKERRAVLFFVNSNLSQPLLKTNMNYNDTVGADFILLYRP